MKPARPISLPVLTAFRSSGGVTGVICIGPYSIMKLVADDNGRLACNSLFPPKRAFSAERQADGSIRLVELVEKEVPEVRARKVNGRWMGAEVQLDRAKVIRAIRADREAR